KNHLVFPLSRSGIESSEGKMRLHLMNYERHVMRPFLENTLAYFQLDLPECIGTFLPTTTPFPLPSEKVRELIREVEGRERMSFPKAFVHDGFKRSEFFLFAAYVIASGQALTDYYDFSGIKHPTIWAGNTREESLQMIASSEVRRLPVFAVHRKAIPRLDKIT